MVFKKQLTPLTKRGQVVKQRGKGSTMQRTPPEQNDMTGGAPLDRMMNRYPKAPPAPPNVPTTVPSDDLG